MQFLLQLIAVEWPTKLKVSNLFKKVKFFMTRTTLSIFLSDFFIKETFEELQIEVSNRALTEGWQVKYNGDWSNSPVNKTGITKLLFVKYFVAVSIFNAYKFTTETQIRTINKLKLTNDLIIISLSDCLPLHRNALYQTSSFLLASSTF